jgi:hypothetical protein
MSFSTPHLTTHGVLLEYQLPLTSKRLDCMLTGKNAESKDNAVIVELKQWEDAQASAVERLRRNSYSFDESCVASDSASKTTSSGCGAARPM